MELQGLLESAVSDGFVPGAVALVARGDEVEVAAVGSVDVEGTAPMARDTIFRIASITKPIVAAAVMVLVDDGVISLDDPVAKWLPELASPKVVRTPAGPVADVVPANRPITVFDLLTSRAGYGFPDRFDWPAVQLIAERLQGDGREVQRPPAPDEWMAVLADIPMVFQPGEQWLYNACSDLQGVLVSRVTGRSLPEFLAERVFEPLAMADTGFAVPAGKLDRFCGYYRATDDGLELADPPDGQWSRLPAFPSGAGGLVSTVDDWHAFGRMLLAGGGTLLSAESTGLMLADHLTQAQRDGGTLFLEGQGWGFGGSVDVARRDPWNVPGRYGWVGGTGTSAHVTPGTGTVALLMTQRAADSPVPPKLFRDFWTYSAGEHR
ncbi:serine hydrolase domain-containing protein [Actinocrispum wychmicini]|nr:serine hydrolase domain-containing protein [Actinocrispum wychmicini]